MLSKICPCALKTNKHTLHLEKEVAQTFAYPLFPLSVSSRPTDTWRSMRKSTTSARMMRKRSRGIPKPLFQSVQFPTLTTTSNTLYQVKSCLWSLCFSVTSVSRTGVQFLLAYIFFLTCYFLWSSSRLCLGLSLPFGWPKHSVLTQAWLQQRITSSALGVCNKCRADQPSGQANAQKYDSAVAILGFLFFISWIYCDELQSFVSDSVK